MRLGTPTTTPGLGAPVTCCKGPSGLGQVSCVSPSIIGVAQILAQRKPTLKWLPFLKGLKCSERDTQKRKNETYTHFKEQLPSPERTHRGTYLSPDNSSYGRGGRRVLTWKRQEQHPHHHTHTQMWNRRRHDCLTTQAAQTLLCALLLEPQKTPLVTSGNEGENSGKWRYDFLTAVMSPENLKLVCNYKAM